MNSFIPVNEPLLNGNEKNYLIECIDSGWISSEGPFVKQLESDFSAYCKQKYGIAVANGSIALDIAVRSIKEVNDWDDGSEIIMPSFTIISCAQSVVINKLKPIFIDADPLTWNIDTDLIEKSINTNTKAIMVVHIYGLPSDMNPIIKLAKKYNLKIIEDTAQAHGQKYFNQICGSFGGVSTFSFYANKHMTTGEGGMILTSCDDIAKKCKYYRNLCFEENNRFVNEELAWNGRMSNLQAAVGVAQFERLEEFIKIKKNMGKRYHELLSDIPALLSLPSTEYAENNYWVFGIVLNNDVKFNAKYAMDALRQKGIGTRPFFYPLHLQPALKKIGITNYKTLKVSENLYNRGFYIPSGLKLSSKQIEIVSQVVKELF